MVAHSVVLLLAVSVAVSALPAAVDPIITKLDPEGLRYDYIRDDDGNPHLVDSWIKASDILQATRYNPDTDNEYHLYTRFNPIVSQPIVPGNQQSLITSNFNPNRRTIILIHGYMGNSLSGLNTVLVPAFLLAGNVNVIVVDWGAGSYFAFNALRSGRSVARFLTWLNQTAGGSISDYHIVGFSVGAHQAGIVGRNLEGQVSYISALDPSHYLTNQGIRATDAVYTEVIHTNAGDLGQTQLSGDVDFYPNGGSNMPGCATSACDHNRAYFYLGESLVAGGFTGTECTSLADATAGNCSLPGRLNMGGINPKTGSTGIYYLQTNEGPPFSQG